MSTTRGFPGHYPFIVLTLALTAFACGVTAFYCLSFVGRAVSITEGFPGHYPLLALPLPHRACHCGATGIHCLSVCLHWLSVAYSLWRHCLSVPFLVVALSLSAFSCVLTRLQCLLCGGAVSQCLFCVLNGSQCISVWRNCLSLTFLQVRPLLGRNRRAPAREALPFAFHCLRSKGSASALVHCLCTSLCLVWSTAFAAKAVPFLAATRPRWKSLSMDCPPARWP